MMPSEQPSEAAKEVRQRIEDEALAVHSDGRFTNYWITDDADAIIQEAIDAERSKAEAVVEAAREVVKRAEELGVPNHPKDGPVFSRLSEALNRYDNGGTDG